MGNTTTNDEIIMKPNWGCCFFMFFICFLVMNIGTWTFVTTLQYTFPVWKCMIRMRIFGSCSLCHIWCFGVNMTPCSITVFYIFYIYYVLSHWTFTFSILDFIFCFFKYLSLQDSNDECIPLAQMQHSQPYMIM